ncbi:MAG: SRPBCC domain-containing protein [Patescibacteria group bacterium]
MKSFQKTYTIKAPVKTVWQALTDAEIIAKWGGGPCDMESNTDFQFSLWGGQIFGKNTQVSPGKKLAQEWSAGNWDQPSVVVFELKSSGGKTELSLSQTDIPDGEFKEIKAGWDKYYIGPLKELAEKLANE